MHFTAALLLWKLHCQMWCKLTAKYRNIWLLLLLATLLLRMGWISITQMTEWNSLKSGRLTDYFTRHPVVWIGANRLLSCSNIIQWFGNLVGWWLASASSAAWYKGNKNLSPRLKLLSRQNSHFRKKLTTELIYQV